MTMTRSIARRSLPLRDGRAQRAVFQVSTSSIRIGTLRTRMPVA